MSKKILYLLSLIATTSFSIQAELLKKGTKKPREESVVEEEVSVESKKPLKFQRLRDKGSFKMERLSSKVETFSDKKKRMMKEAASKDKEDKQKSIINRKPVKKVQNLEGEESLRDILTELMQFNPKIQEAKQAYLAAVKMLAIKSASFVLPDDVSVSSTADSKDLPDPKDPDRDRGGIKIQNLFNRENYKNRISISKNFNFSSNTTDISASSAAINSAKARYYLSIVNVFLSGDGVVPLADSIIELIYAENTLEMHTKTLQQLEMAFDSMKKRSAAEVGLASAADVAYSVAELESAKANLFDAENRIKKAKLAFEAHVGRPPRKSFLKIKNIIKKVNFDNVDVSKTHVVADAFERYLQSRYANLSTLLSSTAPSLNLSASNGAGFTGSSSELKATVNMPIWSARSAEGNIQSSAEASAALYRFRQSLITANYAYEVKKMEYVSLLKQVRAMIKAAEASAIKAGAEERKFKTAYNEGRMDIINPRFMFDAFKESYDNQKRKIGKKQELASLILRSKLEYGMLFDIDKYGNILPKEGLKNE